MLYPLVMMSKQERKDLLQAMAARIKALRRSAGMTQEQLSEKADIATQYVSRLENAHQVPSLYVIVEVAKALDTSPSVLLGDAVPEAQSPRLTKMIAMLSTLGEEDAAFIETQLDTWMGHLRKRE